MKVGISSRTLNTSRKSLREHFQTAYQWFNKTPERALEQAYQAVMRIQATERQYFDGNEIDLMSTQYPPNVMTCLRADLDRHLNTATLRIAEFKMSRSLLGQTNSALLEKLIVIDEFIKKYTNRLAISISSEHIPHQLTTIDADLDRLNETSIKPSSAEKRGVLPRSIGRTINRIKTELNPNAEQELLTNFRYSSTKTRTALGFLALLIIIPVLTQQISKNVLIKPIVHQFQSQQSSEIFLNAEMKEEALQELEAFEKELRFQSLLASTPQLSTEEIETQRHEKAIEITEHFRDSGRDAISNIFADLLGIVVFCGLLIRNSRQISILKSFMDDLIYGLSDSAKAFIIILLTDMFVGYHSTHGWEILLEGLANHLGIAANRGAIFLFIATFPVMLDTLFKYWIFRYLSRTSPSAVATLKNMNE